MFRGGLAIADSQRLGVCFPTLLLLLLAVVVAQWGARLHDGVAAVIGNCDVGREVRVPGASVGAAMCASFCMAEMHVWKQQASTCAKPSVT